MAEGDTSQGAWIWSPSGETAVIGFKAGPRAGERWECRDDRFAAPSSKGSAKFTGVTARVAANGYWFQQSGAAEIVEVGRDQFGRLVGRLRRTQETRTLEDAVAEYAETVVISRTDIGGVAIFTYPTDWPTLGDEGRIEVDKSLP